MGEPAFESVLMTSKKLHPNWGGAFLATRNGLEPSTSSVTGWRANRLHHRAMGGTGCIIADFLRFVKPQLQKSFPPTLIGKKWLLFPCPFAIIPKTQGSYIGNTTASQAVKAGSIPVPCSISNSHPMGGYCLWYCKGNRTHLNATVRWTVAWPHNGGQHHNFYPILG